MAPQAPQQATAAEAAALDREMLDQARCMTDEQKLYRVMCQRLDGTERLYGTYYDLKRAMEIADGLRKVKLQCRVADPYEKPLVAKAED